MERPSRGAPSACLFCPRPSRSAAREAVNLRRRRRPGKKAKNGVQRGRGNLILVRVCVRPRAGQKAKVRDRNSPTFHKSRSLDGE